MIKTLTVFTGEAILPGELVLNTGHIIPMILSVERQVIEHNSGESPAVENYFSRMIFVVT